MIILYSCSRCGCGNCGCHCSDLAVIHLVDINLREAYFVSKGIIASIQAYKRFLAVVGGIVSSVVQDGLVIVGLSKGRNLVCEIFVSRHRLPACFHIVF